MRPELEDKVRQSVLLIRHAYRHATWRGGKLELAYSGGKDSDVLVELCKMGGVWGKDGLRPLHRCTTIDPSGTLKHVKDQGVEVLRPRKDFRHCIMDSGMPSRFVRHCCGELKEFAVEDYVIVGVRRSESVKRSKNYKEPEVCKTYNGRGKAVQYLPLLEWTDDDVREFILERGIVCHPLCYDADGVFHVERRLGCMGCSLMYYKKRQQEFLKYPKMVRLYVRCAQLYLDTHPKVKTHEYFGDACEWLVCELFCKNIVEFSKKFKDLGIDCRKYLEDYFNTTLD